MKTSNGVNNAPAKPTYKIWGSFAWTLDVGYFHGYSGCRPGCQSNWQSKIMKGLYYDKEMDDSKLAFQYLSSLRWVLLHSTLDSSVQSRSDKSRGGQSVPELLSTFVEPWCRPGWRWFLGSGRFSCRWHPCTRLPKACWPRNSHSPWCPRPAARTAPISGHRLP